MLCFNEIKLRGDGAGRRRWPRLKGTAGAALPLLPCVGRQPGHLRRRLLPSGVQSPAGPLEATTPEPSPGRPCALSHGRLRSLKVRSPACRCNAACGHHSGPRCLGGVRACVPLPPVALGGSFVGHPGPSPHPLPLQHPARLSVLSSPHLEGGREEPGTSRAPDNRPKAWATAATPRSSEKGGGGCLQTQELCHIQSCCSLGGCTRSLGCPWGTPRPQDHPGPAAP